jgi:hypothetical protein
VLRRAHPLEERTRNGVMVEIFSKPHVEIVNFAVLQRRGDNLMILRRRSVGTVSGVKDGNFGGSVETTCSTIT